MLAAKTDHRPSGVMPKSTAFCRCTAVDSFHRRRLSKYVDWCHGCPAKAIWNFPWTVRPRNASIAANPSCISHTYIFAGHLPVKASGDVDSVGNGGLEDMDNEGERGVIGVKVLDGPCEKEKDEDAD